MQSIPFLLHQQLHTFTYIENNNKKKRKQMETSFSFLAFSERKKQQHNNENIQNEKQEKSKFLPHPRYFCVLLCSRFTLCEANLIIKGVIKKSIWLFYFFQNSFFIPLPESHEKKMI